MEEMDEFQKALKLLEHKQFSEAGSILRKLLNERPNDVNLLYNLGMCYTELGEPNKAIELLDKCISQAPEFSNAHVALGVALSRQGNPVKAKECLEKSLDLDPNNPYALKNLGSLYGKEGDNQNALSCLKKSFELIPDDPFTSYGIGLAYMKLGDLEKASDYFNETISLNAPDDLIGRAKEALTEIASKELKSKGFRIDAVYYILHVMELFQGMLLEEIKDIAFEIALKGQDGLDINDPSRTYHLRSMKGDFTALQMVCIMYAGFKEIAPGTDVGIDFSEEYAMAQNLFKPTGDT
jgi:tetratricopeptide (TPR) repeat protein